MENLETAVGYIRTAALETNAEEIIKVRKEEISSFCTRQCFLLEEVIVDRGSSAFSPLVTRYGGGTLVDYILKGDIGCIVVKDLFDLGRDSEELLCLMKMIEEKAILLIDLSVVGRDSVLSRRKVSRLSY